MLSSRLFENRSNKYFTILLGNWSVGLQMMKKNFLISFLIDCIYYWIGICVMILHNFVTFGT